MKIYLTDEAKYKMKNDWFSDWFGFKRPGVTPAGGTIFTDEYSANANKYFSRIFDEGIPATDFIKLEDDVLTIRAEHKEQIGKPGWNCTMSWLTPESQEYVKYIMQMS